MSPWIKRATLKEISSHREQTWPQRDLNISLMISQSVMTQLSLIQLLHRPTTTSTPSALRKWVISGDGVEVLQNYHHLGVMSHSWQHETSLSAGNAEWADGEHEEPSLMKHPDDLSQHAPAVEPMELQLTSCSGTRWPKWGEERPDESTRGEYRRWDETRRNSKRAKKRRRDEGNKENRCDERKQEHDRKWKDEKMSTKETRWSLKRIVRERRRKDEIREKEK